MAMSRTEVVKTDAELTVLFRIHPADAGNGLTIPTSHGEWRKEAQDAWRLWLAFEEED